MNKKDFAEKLLKTLKELSKNEKEIYFKTDSLGNLTNISDLDQLTFIPVKSSDYLSTLAECRVYDIKNRDYYIVDINQSFDNKKKSFIRFEHVKVSISEFDDLQESLDILKKKFK